MWLICPATVSNELNFFNTSHNIINDLCFAQLLHCRGVCSKSPTASVWYVISGFTELCVLVFSHRNIHTSS